jgi:GTP-binding protein
VLNKSDLLPPDEVEARREDVVARLGWRGPVFVISAEARTGIRELAAEVMAFLEKTLATAAVTE